MPKKYHGRLMERCVQNVVTHTNTRAILELIAFPAVAGETARRNIDTVISIDCTRVVELCALVHVCKAAANRCAILSSSDSITARQGFPV